MRILARQQKGVLRVLGGGLRALSVLLETERQRGFLGLFGVVFECLFELRGTPGVPHGAAFGAEASWGAPGAFLGALKRPS